MISRVPTGSLIGVTHSDSDGWLACDEDILSAWPTATGYSLITAYEGWPNWSGPNAALLWEVFGPDCPGPESSEALRAWTHIDGAVKRAQHVFLLPDVLDVQPLLIYRCIVAPDQDLVQTAVMRAQRIREDSERRERVRREIFGEPKPFDQEES